MPATHVYLAEDVAAAVQARVDADPDSLTAEMVVNRLLRQALGVAAPSRPGRARVKAPTGQFAGVRRR